MRQCCFRASALLTVLLCVVACRAAEPISIVSPSRSSSTSREEDAAYSIRPDDQLEFVFRIVREEAPRDYRFEIGDVLRIESFVDDKLNRDLSVQADGTIDVPLLEPLRVLRQTSTEVQNDLNERYKKYYKLTDIHVTRVKTHTRAADLLRSLQNEAGAASRVVRVTPEGTVSLPSIGTLPAQGLLLAEIEREATERYRQLAGGLEVSALVAQRAPQFVFLVGEVRSPGRHELTGPTTLLQAIALGGGWTTGRPPAEIIIARRDLDGQLLATRLDARGVLCGERSLLAGDCWICDGDVVIAAPPAQHRGSGDWLRCGGVCTLPAWLK